MTTYRQIEATYEIAHKASQDAGNRNMRAAGRSKWNEDDWNVAAAEFERLFVEPRAQHSA